jgi:hypothetical protein
MCSFCGCAFMFSLLQTVGVIEELYVQPATRRAQGVSLTGLARKCAAWPSTAAENPYQRPELGPRSWPTLCRRRR